MKLWRHLPEARARRRPRYARRRHGRRFSPELSILHRPGIVRDRKQLGHWECNLLQFRKKFGKVNVTSLVERVSRFTVFLRNNDRQSKPIMDGLIEALARPCPLQHVVPSPSTAARNSPTGPTCRPASVFSDPQSRWQKGTVENTNRRARKWLSRDTDPLPFDDRHLKQAGAHLNATPRKCLGFRTPAEVFRHKLLAARR